MKEAVIIGYSGHAYVVLEILKANGFELFGYCEQEKRRHNPYGLPYLGCEEDIQVLKFLAEKDVFIGIGSNQTRSNIFLKLKSRNISLPSVQHPSAIVSGVKGIGDGTIIMPGVVINPLVTIGRAVICNTSAVIEHECIIGDFTHIAPGAVLAGGVVLGNNCFIGANAVVKQGVRIGHNVTIGAGSVVLDNVSNNCTIYGNPAKSKTA